MYSEASEAVNARIGCASKKFRELSRVLVSNQNLFSKLHDKIYQSRVRAVISTIVKLENLLLRIS